MLKSARSLRFEDHIDALRDQFVKDIAKVPRSIATEGFQLELIHQYTRLGTVIDVFNAYDKDLPREVWATSIAYMNDTQEFEHARILFIELVHSLRDEKSLRVRPGVFDALEKWARTVDGRSVFCACYSAKRDDLNQWRAYADGGRGACLSFDLKMMQEAFPQYSGWIVYNVDKQRELVKRIVKDLSTTLHGVKDAKICMQDDKHDPILRFLALVFSFLKHPKFEEEAEFRIAYLRHQNEGPVENFFRAAGTRIQPYVKLTMIKNGNTAPLPLRCITLSPGARGRDNLDALNELLIKRKIKDVECKESDIPFLPVS